MQRCKTQLILNRAAKRRVIIHDFILITELLRELEKQPVPEPAIFWRPLSFLLGLLVLTEGVQAASFEAVDVAVVVRPLHQLVVDVHRLLVVTVVEGAVSDAEIRFQIMPVRVFAVTFEKSKGS